MINSREEHRVVMSITALLGKKKLALHAKKFLPNICGQVHIGGHPNKRWPPIWIIFSKQKKIIRTIIKV
jgi:hypothetical protein